MSNFDPSTLPANQLRARAFGDGDVEITVIGGKRYAIL
jgi:hypothetical protein